MRISDIIKDIRIRHCYLKDDVEINDIKINSAEVKSGDLFIAIKGENFDGNDYILNALQNGASVVFSEREFDEDFGDSDKIVRVENARSAYAIASKNFFDRECDKLKIIAVTGTNGKTTIANTTTDLLRFVGAKVGVIGTLGAKIDDKVIDTGLTTPDPYMLHKIFKEMRKNGCEYVVMEASAHALALNKLDGIKFEIGVLTNITEDHLDFFKTMDNYANAKFNLFERGKVKLGIVCGDDERCRELLIKAKVPMISYGINRFCDVHGVNINKSFSGSKFDCYYLGEKIDIKTELVGEYNIQNALASIAICRSLGVPAELVRLGMSCISPVEGRFNIIKTKNNNIIIDYAHTPDGLEKILTTARDLSDKRLVVVFGCGGNRDRQKRPIMGEIASSLADYVILTSDNPRFEEPLDIISEINAGAVKPCKIIENRKNAIEFALKNFCDGQTIVIAGKGAEKYQDIKGVKQPYNDFDVVYNFERQKIKSLTKREENFDDENEQT